MADIPLQKVTPEKMANCCAPYSDSEDNVWYPHIHIDFDDLPVAKNWENGQMYEIRAIVRQVESTIKSADFEIREIGGADSPVSTKDSKPERYPRNAPDDNADG